MESLVGYLGNGLQLYNFIHMNLFGLDTSYNRNLKTCLEFFFHEKWIEGPLPKVGTF